MQQDSDFVKKAKKIIKENPEYFEALVEFEKTGKLPKLSYKKRANFTINSKILKEFQEYCKKNSINMSLLIEKFMFSKIKE